MTAINLTPAQKKVISYRGGDLQVIACAGSGKTESISRRIAALIDEGAAPASIVAFTFTERAAAALKARINKRVAELKGKEFLDRLGPMFVGTIHAFCFRLLQEHVPLFGSYDVLDEHRHVGLLNREFFSLPEAAYGHFKKWRVEEWIRTADIIGNELIASKDLKGTDAGRFYEAYRALLDRYHVLTFGLIIQRAVESLEKPEIATRVRAPLRYLVVDEYQDINPAQERLIQLLSQAPVELCVVGDDDQCIYQWRGSDVRYILDFEKRKRVAARVPLEDNRRSRPDIIKTANAISKKLEKRLAKRMKAVRTGGVNEVVCWTAETPEKEATRIVETISRLRGIGYRYRDIAILCRSVRTSAPPIIDALRAKRIPFAAGGRTGLFLQPEISLFGELYAWMVDESWSSQRYGGSAPASIDNLVAGLNTSFGNGKSIRGLRAYLDEWKAEYAVGKGPVNLVGDFYRLLWRLGAQAIDVDDADGDGSARFGAYARFSRVLADFESVWRRGRQVSVEGGTEWRGGRDRGADYLKALQRYLFYYARGAYEEFEGEVAAETDAVDILTIHQAKGLEWPIVFVPALVKGRFPSSKSGRAQQWQLDEAVFPPPKRCRYEGSEDEERRLFYVAVTRARDSLYLSGFERMKKSFSRSAFFDEAAGDSVVTGKKLPLPGAPEALTDDELPPLELSFSDVAAFDECGFRYRLGSVFGFEEEIAVELGYGKAIHQVLRSVADEVRSTGKVPKAARLEDLVEREFYLPLASKPARERMLKAGHRLVKRYVDDFEADLHRVWATERPFALHLEDGTINGRADVILDMHGGEIGSLAIVDYKVAGADEHAERYSRQLQVYVAAGRGEGLKVEGAHLHELGTGMRRDVDTSPGVTQAVVAGAAQSVKRIRGGHFVPAPDRPKCESCAYSRICPHTAHRE